MTDQVATPLPEPMPEQPVRPRPVMLIVLLAGVLGAILAGTIALWAHYGTTVFFETVRAGFAACFG
jgi:hypothetical protein